MSGTTYLKGVRTRYRNILSTEMSNGKEILSGSESELDIERASSNVSTCCERIKLYCEKVEIQSEKLASALEEKEITTTESIMDEDCTLCSEAMNIYLDLKQHKEKLRKGIMDIKKEREDEPITSKLVELQENMQELLHKQMRQEEIKSKKDSDRVTSIKLPKIEMISFSGDKTKWTEFWESFQCAIHNNKTISNVEKFNYLRSKVFGEARSAIAGLALSNENYTLAINILEKRYGNVQEIVDLHYNQLISMQPATTKVSNLRHFLDTVERHLRSLEVLKQNVDQDVFVSMIRSKLPEDVLIQLEIQNGPDKKWTVCSLTKGLSEYVVVRERATKETKSGVSDKCANQASNSTFKSSNAYRHTGASNFREGHYKTSSHAVITTADKKRTYVKPSNGANANRCRFCQNQHWSDECKTYQTISERKERIKGSCFKCLKDGHLFRDCKTHKACVYCGEMNVHHRSLCPKKFLLKHSMSQVVNETYNLDESTKESTLMSMNEMVLMQTATTDVRNPETYEFTSSRLFLDSGSHRSYITERCAKLLNLKEDGEQDIHLVTFGSKSAKKVTTKYTKLDLKLKNGKHIQITANIVPVISGELQRRPVYNMWSDSVQDIINSVELADTIPTENETAPIEILIGNDYYLELVIGEKIKVQEGLYLLASKLGWILSGRMKDLHDDCNTSSMLILTYGNTLCKSEVYSCVDASLPVKPDLEDFWNVESIGIVDKEIKTDDDIAMDKFRNSLKFEYNRYQVTWPWKEDQPELPTNRELAIGRLKTSVNRMKNKSEMLQKYDTVISDQLQKGMIEKVEPTDVHGILHYLPHHAVITPQNTTTKLRVVYDASAKSRKGNNSLNDCLYRGPVMLHDLCGMLMRFRLHPIALVADIEKAFLQIGLQKDQRDVTRFMWLKDVNQPRTDKDNIQEYRFCRVPFGVVSSPFLLGATVEYHLDSYNTDIAEKIKGDIYVDNVITGTNTVAEAKKLYTECKEMFKEGSMNIREWISNNKEVNHIFSSEDKVTEESAKVLGHRWNTKTDSLSFKPLQKITNNLPVTKRSVLKEIASVYDPLGLVCPVVLRGKLFMQHLWENNIEWDEVLVEDDQQKWFSIRQNMEMISEVCVQRNIIQTSPGETEYRLMCFCDASEKAYASVVYLHQRQDHQSTTHLIFAKTRLAPLKKISIPRLELLAVVIGVRCLKFVKEQLKLKVSDSYIWSVSQCVLHWIKSEKTLSVFVRNRVKEIRKASEAIFGYVPTKENPADIASRGADTVNLCQNEQWWKGPQWLNKHFNEWPKFDCPVDETILRTVESEVHESKKTEASLVHHSHEQDKKGSSEADECSPLGIRSSDFSSLTRLLRVTVLALRFIRKLRKSTSRTGFITYKEIQEAELMWLKHVQDSSYTEVFDAIESDKQSSIQKQLGLYRDPNGILRCKGRLENASLSENARCPILLPKQDWYSRLVVEKTHKEILHSGVSQTLSTTRLKYWIPHGRAFVKKVLNMCSVCRRFEGGPYKMPPLCSYPKSRVTESCPFSRIGLDYMGPLYIKTENGDKKVWICLFTCLVTRAIHLELVCDMSTPEFLLCLRRFISQRGTPNEIVSDNAMQFRAASHVVDRIWNRIHTCDTILDYVSNSGIRWRFNVELAPWMGGFYERLVGLVKRALRKTVGRRKLTMVQMQTMVKEIEAVVNSRPLVYVGDDINSNIPITPSHFLTMNPKIGIPEMEITEDSDYLPVVSTAEKILQIWKKGQKLLDMFWHIWRNEYLTCLRERTQTTLRSGRVQSHHYPCVNDVVLIKEDCGRGSWRFGKVTELVKSRDASIRSAKVVLPSGKEIGRPLNLLYPLEVSCERQKEDQNLVKTPEKQDVRPKRQAAVDAERQIRRILHSE